MSNDFKSVLEVRTEVSWIYRWVGICDMDQEEKGKGQVTQSHGVNIPTFQRLRTFAFPPNIRT